MASWCRLDTHSLYKTGTEVQGGLRIHSTDFQGGFSLKIASILFYLGVALGLLRVLLLGVLGVNNRILHIRLIQHRLGIRHRDVHPQTRSRANIILILIQLLVNLLL